jgi:hypothetical protein
VNLEPSNELHPFCPIRARAAMTRTARCACGSTSITVSGEPEIYGVCHCTNCKQRTGSAFGISSYFKRAEVIEQAGRTNVYAFHHLAQDHDQERHFCCACGTTLFWYVSALPELVGVAGGCFGEVALGEPRMSVTHSKKLPWVELPPSWRVVHE